LIDQVTSLHCRISERKTRVRSPENAALSNTAAARAGDSRNAHGALLLAAYFN
jgi:hypothetical protein